MTVVGSVVGLLVRADCCCGRYARCRAGRYRTGGEASGSVTIGVDAGGGDRLALAVLAQYRMATTEQMHRVIAPKVRIEQTRRRLARLRTEGLLSAMAQTAAVPGSHLLVLHGTGLQWCRAAMNDAGEQPAP